MLQALAIAAISALALTVAALAPPSAHAHVPFLEPGEASDAPARPGNPFPGAVEVPDAAVSRAVYGTLATDAAFDVWAIGTGADSSTPIQILVPAGARHEAFRPSFALIGPGLVSDGSPPGFVAERLELAGDAGPAQGRGAVGVIVVADPGAAARPTFYEPFSFTRYYEGGSTRVELEGGRTYYLVVYDPRGGAGEYVLGVGERESFTLTDAGASVGAVARIKLGLYGQSDLHGGAVLVAAGVVATLAAAAAVLVARYRRRAVNRSAARGGGR